MKKRTKENILIILALIVLGIVTFNGIDALVLNRGV